MPKTSVEPTTAENLEAKFDAGEDVLDYFDLKSTRVIEPEPGAEPPSASVTRLRRALEITEQIQKLEKELVSVLQSELSVAASAPEP